MEMMELAELRKAFMRSENRYVNPHAEAMKLRTLWTFYQRPSRSRDAQRVNQLFEEAKKFAKLKEFSKALCTIKKGLYMNPRHHSMYALRADIFLQQDDLDAAVQNYGEARKMLEFDKKSANGKSTYTRNLIKIYWKRGLRNYERGRLLEASSDFEQSLVLRPYGEIVNDIQDELLKTLKRLDKYEAFCYEWARFLNDADPSRTSSLLTQYAEYKIFRREMDTARHVLFEAIDLDSDNDRAHELLQVVYDTGHHLVAFSIMWSVYGCHDKALMSIEKARDCDPYNPGYTLLKAIVLRVSGRLLEAAKWLESVDKGFHKLLEPSRDKQGSIMGNLTIEQTKTQLVKQWYLIRYDIAVQFMIDERYEDALTILKNSKLREQYAETHMLMGDCMLKLGETDKALGMYLNCWKSIGDPKTDVKSRKNILLLKRISDILNNKCNRAVDDKRSEDAIKIAEDLVGIFDKTYGPDSTILGQNLGEALFCKARAHYQTEGVQKNSACCWSMAEALKLSRVIDDHELYRNIFNDAKMERVVDNFGTKRKLPESLKLLMQYS